MLKSLLSSSLGFGLSETIEDENTLYAAWIHFVSIHQGKDGTKISMFIVRQKGVKKDGKTILDCALIDPQPVAEVRRDAPARGRADR